MKMSALQFCGDTKYFYSGKSNMNVGGQGIKKFGNVAKKKSNYFGPRIFHILEIWGLLF